MKTGDFIKKYRKHKKLSGARLAESIGVSAFRLQKWEGGSTPNLEDGEKIKAFFKVRNITDLSENLLKKVLSPESSTETNVEDLLQLKDQLIKEKDKRIADLEKIIELQNKMLEGLKK